MQEPNWITEARKHIGLMEIAGTKHHSEILSWWDEIGLGGINDDETPYCAAFVGAMLKRSGLDYLKSGWARDYMRWGIPLAEPKLGSVVVFSRAGGGGHVGFCVGLSADKRPMVLGANQANAVNIKPFDPTRVLGYRWPRSVPIPTAAPLPLLAATGESSTSEA